MQGPFIRGVGLTRFARWPDRSVRSLAVEAASQALDQAELDPRDIDLVVFGNAAGGLLSGQEMIRGQVALLPLQLAGIPVLNVENACASSSSAVHVADMAVRSGSAGHVLVVGAEKLSHPDRARTFKALAAGVDLQTMLDERQDEDDDAISDRLSGGGSKSTFMDHYARQAQRYMDRSGAEPADFAAVVVKSRAFASMNDRAQFRGTTTVEEVLAERTISDPLTLPMCSPIGDGAAALVVSAEPGPEALAVRIRASVLRSGGGGAAAPAAARAVDAAYEQASVSPHDLDVIEVHDAAAPAELQAYETLRLCSTGEGPAFLRSGATGPGGGSPVNPSGGLLSRGHPVGATGAAQIAELYLHLSGRAGSRTIDGARLGLAQNAGGTIDGDTAACTVTILEGVRT